MSKRFVVLALVATFALTGCATYSGGRPSAILPGAALGAAIGGAKGGLGGAATGAAIGGATGLVLDFFGALGGRGYGNDSEAAQKIREYCESKYGNSTGPFAACINGAWGRRHYYSGSGGGINAGRAELLRDAARDGEQFGKSLGKAGL